MKTRFTNSGVMRNLFKLITLTTFLTLTIPTAWGASPAELTWTSDITHNVSANGMSDDFDVFTASYAKSTGPNDPVYWNKSSTYGIKLYATKNTSNGNSITISTSQANIYITKIEVTGSTAQGTCSLYWDSSTSTTGTSKTYTEASKTQSSTFALKETGGSKNGQYIVTKIKVTYTVTSSCTPYTITLANSGTATNGTFSCATSACEDDIVTLTATPATGYQLASWSVYKTGTPATTITVTNNQFTMPAYGVTVNATFEPLVVNIVLTNKSNGHVQSCVTEGAATVTYNATALTTFSPVSRDGYNDPSAYWTAPSGGVQVLNADGSFAATNVNGYITNGRWSSTTTPVELYARISCDDAITLTATGTNGTVSLSRSSIETCNCTAEARRVTITATPNSGYEATAISYSGDGSASKISGPTKSGDVTTWVYEFEQNDDGSGTFTVTFTEKAYYTVTWDAAGTTSTSSVLTGEKPAAFPSTPASCDTDNAPDFYGWATEPWSGSVDDLAGKTVYTAVEDLPAVSGPVTYYAVWCKGGGWTKTTSLTIGDVVKFTYDADGYYLTSISGNLGTAATSGDPYLLTIEAGYGGTGYSFKNGDNYLSWSSGNTLTTSSTKDNASSWTISTSEDGNFKFSNVGTTTRLLQFNSSYPRWACYESTQKAFQIYKIAGGDHYITTCCSEISRPNVTVELHSTYVTLTWPNDANAVSYSVTCSGGTVGSITGTNTKSCSITGLTGETSYTYSVTATGSTCSQSANGSFTTANCDDVPFVESAVASGTFVTFNWRNTNNNTTIKLYSDEGCTIEVRSKATTFTTTSKSDTIAGLEQETTYYYILWSNGTCPSISGSFTTLENRITIAEWDTEAVYLDLSDMTSATAIVANQNTQAEVTQNYADSIFISKYFEADGTNKMIAIYNGTKDTVPLSNYRLDRSQKNSNSVNTYKLKLSNYGRIKPGYICPTEEIIIVKYSSGDASGEACLEEGDGHENWYNESANSTAPDGFTAPSTFLDFSGPMSIGLYCIPAGKYIDVIGATTKADGTGGLVQIESSNNSVCSYARYNTDLNDKPGGFYQLDGDNYKTEATENDYFLSTNRCLLIRNNKVKSGLNSITRNVYDDSQMDCNEDIVKAFVTLSASEEEWRGFQIGSGDAGSTETHANTCEGMAEVGHFDYNEYYAKYDTILTGINLSDQRQDDGTYKIEISQLDTMSCTNLKIIVQNNTTGEKISGTWKVPIFVTDDGGTGGDGNVKTNDEIFTREGPDCATCDVVVLKNANLEVVTGGKNQVRNIEVYAGATLNVPSGKEYLVNQLIMRSKDDVVSKALVKGTLTPTVKNVYLDKRIKTGRWYWISLPYRCRIADVTWRNGELANYGTDWLLKTYDGNNRANGIQTGNWIQYTGEYMEPGVGYILNFNSDILESGNQYAELRFPMAMDGASISVPASVNVPVIAYGANNSRTKDGEPVRPNHLGWNMIGNPYMNTYNKGNMPESLPTGELVKDPETDDLLWKRNTDGVRYVVVPRNGGHSGYSQVAVGTQELDPFMAYFVQVNGTSDNQALQIAFSSSNVKTSMIRHVPVEYEEDDTHPVWVGFTLSNAEGEKDETALLVSDNFTDDYDMMNDLIKWRGTYYKYAKYNTAPVLATRNNEGEMAFNALSDASAAAGVPVNYFAAAAGTYTFSMSNLYSLEEVEEAWLYDSEENRWTNLLLEDYSFYTAKGDNTTRFTLTAKVARRIVETPTDADNINAELSLRTIDHTLLLSGVPQGSSIYVYDMSGKMVAGERTAVANMRLTVPADGVYNVRIVSPEGNQTLRAIVK